MRKKIITTCLLALALASLNAPVWAANRKEPNTKAGAVHYTHASASYSLQSSTDLQTSSEDLVGAAFFYERVFLSRFSMGLKVTSGLQSSGQVTIDSTVVDITQKVTFYSLDFKSYFKDHSAGGLKPYLGVGFGQYTASTTLTEVGTTTNTEGTTAAAVPVTSLNVGADYVTDFGGMRVDLGLIAGTARDRDSHTTYDAKYDFSGTALSIGVFSFF